jgi:small subunit ribosomal protein S21
LKESYFLEQVRQEGQPVQSGREHFHIEWQVIDSVSNQTGIEVTVRDNDVEQALKALKRKIARDGLLKQLKSKKAYEKPSERRKRKERESKRRIRKAMARRAKRAFRT